MESYEEVKQEYKKLISDIATMSGTTEEEIEAVMNNSGSMEEVLQKAMESLNHKDNEG